MTAHTHDIPATERVLAALRESNGKPRRGGDGWVASCPCPSHGKGRGDRSPSLAISEGRDGNAVIFCHAGCHTEDILSALHLEPSDLFADDGSRNGSRGNVYPILRTFTLPDRPANPATDDACTDVECRKGRRNGEICTARYTYADIEGTPLGIVHRWKEEDGGKTFRPSTPDGSGGWKLRGTIPPVPYAYRRAAETLAGGGCVLIVEGEKDADTVNGYALADLAATTNAGGAKKWKEDHARALVVASGGAGQVVICGDNDDAGRAHAAIVRDTFLAVGRPAPMIVYPTRGKDVTEHLENGGTLDLGDPNGLQDPSEYTRPANVLTLSDLADLPPIRTGIDGWTSSPSAVLLVGPYSVGKSAATLSMACSVATGTTFLGNAVERRRVLYVVGEGARGLHRRTSAWRQIWGRDLSEDDLLFMKRPKDSLREEKSWDEIRRICRGEGIGWVCLDTLSSLAPEADETKDAALIVAGLNGLAEDIDGTAILVHHPGWSASAKDRARGGYQLEGNVDEVIVLDAIAEGSDVVSAKIKKRKDGEAGATHYLRRIGVHLHGPDGAPLYDEDGEPVTAVTVEHARLSDTEVPMRERILRYLGEWGDLGATPKEIAESIGVRPKDGAYGKALRGLVADGEIRAEGSTTRRRYFADEET